MSLEIAQLGQPILRAVARDVPAEEIATPEFQQFLEEMIETMNESGGVGLAAPQVFVGKRVFVARIHPPQKADDSDDPEEVPGLEIFINPRLVAVSEEKVAAWEGCLSFMELTVLVPRHRRVIVEFLDAQGQAKSFDLVDFPARVVQHENDHLDGVLTMDRAASTRDIVKSSEMEVVLEERKKRREKGE